MSTKRDLEERVAAAAQEQGISSTLLRSVVSKKLGLNVADVECFGLLNAKGISTPTELARYTGMTPGSATVMLDRLEKAKLIVRKPNPNDRRGTLIEINKKSAARVGAMFAGVRKAQSELIASYSEKELEIVVDFLTRFTKNLKKQAMVLEDK